jgi:DNA-directed RNA polymerase specialized sigma24 family protein
MSSTVFSFPADADPLASLLTAFLKGDTQARTKLHSLLHKRLAKFARRLVPIHLAEDAVQRMWELLLRKSPDSFDLTRVSAVQYLILLLRTAARDVRAAETAPGQRTRTQRDLNGDFIESTPVLSLDDTVLSGDGEGGITMHEVIGRPDDQFDALNARSEAEWLLARAWQVEPGPVSHALELIYQTDFGVEEAAQRVGLSRFQLRRGINRVRAHIQLPLAA